MVELAGTTDRNARTTRRTEPTALGARPPRTVMSGLLADALLDAECVGFLRYLLGYGRVSRLNPAIATHFSH